MARCAGAVQGRCGGYVFVFLGSIATDTILNNPPTRAAANSKQKTDSHIEPVPLGEDGRPLNDPSAPARAELADLKESLADAQPAGALVNKCRSLDQARAVVTFLDAASEKTLRATVALTASRGRGKVRAFGEGLFWAAAAWCCVLMCLRACSVRRAALRAAVC